MLAPTHSVFGIFMTLIILALFGIQLSLHWTIILFAIIGSIIPDIDHPRSTVGKLFRFISDPLERRYGHRTITHSIFGWFLSTIIFSFFVCVLFGVLNFFRISNFDIGNLVPRWVGAFSISYFSHLILDMLNPRGSQMFWPEKGRDVIPKNPKFRPESGSKAEVFIFIILFALMFLSLPLSKYGISSCLRWLLATPGSAIEEFKSLKTHAYLDFTGVFNETKEPVSGKGEVLGVENKRLIILYQNNVYSLSDELSADILAKHVRMKSTKTPINIERKVFTSKSREYLLSQIPTDALVSGTINLPEGMTVDFSQLRTSNIEHSTFNSIEQKSNDLVLKYASKDQIRKLALNSKYEFENRKDIAEMLKLRADMLRIRRGINEAKEGDGLTPLGREILGSELYDKQQIQLAELESQRVGTIARMDELQAKIDSRKLLFSGDVYIRR